MYVMILPFDYIGYKRLSENKRLLNHRWYIDATWWEIDECCPLLIRRTVSFYCSSKRNMFVYVFQWFCILFVCSLVHCVYVYSRAFNFCHFTLKSENYKEVVSVTGLMVTISNTGWDDFGVAVCCSIRYLHGYYIWSYPRLDQNVGC
jgi:hypothetical protein